MSALADNDARTQTTDVASAAAVDDGESVMFRSASVALTVVASAPVAGGVDGAGVESPRRQPISVAEVTRRTACNGRRRMEDRSVVIDDLAAYSPAAASTDAPPTDAAVTSGEWPDVFGYYAVFDGHSGTVAAVFCHNELHRAVAASPYMPLRPADALVDAFADVERRFCADERRSGCTALVTLVGRRHIYVAWAGDSIAVLSRDGRAQQLVHCHRPDRNDERARIERLGGIVMHYGSWRVQGVLSVTRAIGDIELKPFVTAQPAVTCVELDGSEEVLVLASDGVWEQVDANEMIVILLQQSEAYGEPTNDKNELVQRVERLAIERGSSDNISLIVVWLRSPPQPVTDNVDGACPSGDVRVGTIWSTDTELTPNHLDVCAWPEDLYTSLCAAADQQEQTECVNAQQDAVSASVCDSIDSGGGGGGGLSGDAFNIEAQVARALSQVSASEEQQQELCGDGSADDVVIDGTLDEVDGLAEADLVDDADSDSSSDDEAQWRYVGKGSDAPLDTATSENNIIEQSDHHIGTEDHGDSVNRANSDSLPLDVQSRSEEFRAVDQLTAFLNPSAREFVPRAVSDNVVTSSTDHAICAQSNAVEGKIEAHPAAENVSQSSSENFPIISEHVNTNAYFNDSAKMIQREDQGMMDEEQMIIRSSADTVDAHDEVSTHLSDVATFEQSADDILSPNVVSPELCVSRVTPSEVQTIPHDATDLLSGVQRASEDMSADSLISTAVSDLLASSNATASNIPTKSDTLLPFVSSTSPSSPPLSDEPFAHTDETMVNTPFSSPAVEKPTSVSSNQQLTNSDLLANYSDGPSLIMSDKQLSFEVITQEEVEVVRAELKALSLQEEAAHRLVSAGGARIEVISGQHPFNDIGPQQTSNIASIADEDVVVTGDSIVEKSDPTESSVEHENSRSTSEAGELTLVSVSNAVPIGSDVLASGESNASVHPSCNDLKSLCATESLVVTSTTRDRDTGRTASIKTSTASSVSKTTVKSATAKTTKSNVRSTVVAKQQTLANKSVASSTSAVTKTARGTTSKPSTSTGVLSRDVGRTALSARPRTTVSTHPKSSVSAGPTSTVPSRSTAVSASSRAAAKSATSGSAAGSGRLQSKTSASVASKGGSGVPLSRVSSSAVRAVKGSANGVSVPAVARVGGKMPTKTAPNAGKTAKSVASAERGVPKRMGPSSPVKSQVSSVAGAAAAKTSSSSRPTTIKMSPTAGKPAARATAAGATSKMVPTTSTRVKSPGTTLAKKPSTSTVAPTSRARPVVNLSRKPAIGEHKNERAGAKVGAVLSPSKKTSPNKAALPSKTALPAKSAPVGKTTSSKTVGSSMSASSPSAQKKSALGTSRPVRASLIPGKSPVGNGKGVKSKCAPKTTTNADHSLHKEETKEVEDVLLAIHDSGGCNGDDEIFLTMNGASHKPDIHCLPENAEDLSSASSPLISITNYDNEACGVDAGGIPEVSS